jgi:hypothetical protein
MNLPYDFGKKTGDKFLWEAKAPAIGIGSIRKPLPVNVKA